MASPAEGSKRIEAEASVGVGTVQIVRQRWSGPIDMSGAAPVHHLQLSLLPCFDSAIGCFPDHWGPHRFEPIGDIFFLPAEHKVRTRSLCQHQNAIVCDFDPAAVAAWIDDELTWTDVRLRSCLDIPSSKIRGLLMRLGEEVRAPGFAGKTMVELIAAQLAIEISRHLIGVAEARTTGGLAAWRLRLIDDRLDGGGAPPSLTELAGLCGLSVRHLTRAFQVSRGRSIGAYIAEHRINQAKAMLARGLDVKVVAFELGFSAASNFSIAFRRVTGESPRDYRSHAVRGAGARRLAPGRLGGYS